METGKYSITRLKNAEAKGDSNGILSSLLELKKHLRGTKNVTDVDKETYAILINLIKYPNSKIMDVSMSILANCSLKNSHREMFKDLGGISHLVLVVKTIENDSIICRACRLLGNLAYNPDLAVALNEYNVGYILLKSLENADKKSAATLMMILRAVKKLWIIKEYRLKMIPEDVSKYLYKCLCSKDSEIVQQTIKMLTLVSNEKATNKNFELVNEEILTKLIDLSEENNMNDIVVDCLSSFLNNQTNQVWKYLEGSKLPLIFTAYILQVNSVNSGVLKALFRLCTEGAVRSKIKHTGLLSKLVELCCESNTNTILAIFNLFQFDISSIAMLAQDKKFISLLINNIPKGNAVRLLAVVSRLDPPVQHLIINENLNVMLKNESCQGILKKISQTKRFLNQLIISGRIWEMARVNCLAEDQGQYAEELIVHLLRTGGEKAVENAALAVPFLVKPRHFELYNILAHHDTMTILLRLLAEQPLEERVLASIIKLMNIFKENCYNNYTQSQGFYYNKLNGAEKRLLHKNEATKSVDVAQSKLDFKSNRISKCDKPEMVAFKLDCGSSVTVNKTLLCENSPVLNAMLNGYFLESNSEQVRLSCCSKDAILNLEKMLENGGSVTKMSIEIHLELISLTDRFLISSLSDLLTDNLPLDQSSCVAVLEWCQNSGFTKNNGIIREKAYDFVMSSSSRLLRAMRRDSLRTHLVHEISNFLTASLRILF